MWSLIAIALAPAIAILLFLYLRDPDEPEPWGLLLLSFILGTLAIFPAMVSEVFFDRIGFGNKSTFTGLLIHTFLVVGLSEEGFKFLILRGYIYRKPSFNEPYDGIIYNAMVSMGFASVENILYIVESSDPFHTGLLRMFTAVPAHATFAIIMGYFTGLARFSTYLSFFYLTCGLLAAVLFHGAYDFFLMQHFIPGISAGAFISLAIGVWLSLKAVKIHGR